MSREIPEEFPKVKEVVEADADTVNLSSENQPMEADVGNDELTKENVVYNEVESSEVNEVNLLSVVSDQTSPIAAPRRSSRSFIDTENIPLNYENTSKRSFLPVGSKSDNESDNDEDFGYCSPKSKESNETCLDKVGNAEEVHSPPHNEISNVAEKTLSAEKTILKSNNEGNGTMSSSMETSLSNSGEKESKNAEEIDSPHNESRMNVSEKTLSAEKTSNDEGNDQSSSKRVTRSKITNQPTELDDSAPRRLTRTKAKALDGSLNEGGDDVGSRRMTRTKTKSGDTSATEVQSERRVTRSKVSKVASDEENSKAQRSTRTFSKKEASTASLTKSAASPRVRELAAKVLSPATMSTPPRATCNLGYTGSPIRDRVRAFENAVKESSRPKSSSDEEVVPPPKTPTAQYFTPKRKSSIASSLRKVSAARKMTVSQVVEEQEVNVVSPPRKGLEARKSPAKTKVNLNNSRAPAGKIVKAGKKVMASGGRGITPGSGSGTGSNSLMKSRSRMNIIEKAGRVTPLEKAGRTTPIEKAGRTTPQGQGPVNLRTGVTSFLPQKPKGPTLEEIQDKKGEERRMKEQREAEARLRKEEQMKQKADELKRQREERMKRVREAREKNENNKEKELSKRREEKETQEKLAVLKKKEERHKEAERKRKEAEKKGNDERLQKEENERLRKEEDERKQAKLHLEEERRKEKLHQEQQRKEEEHRRMEEKRAYAAREKERILREQEELRKLNSQNSAPKSDLNSTYNKPGDATFNKTQTFDQSIVSDFHFNF